MVLDELHSLQVRPSRFVEKGVGKIVPSSTEVSIGKDFSLSDFMTY